MFKSILCYYSKMGGSSTYGYETHDGKIHYCVYRDWALLEDILSVFKKGKVYQIQDDDGDMIVADSLEDYFSDNRSIKEDSAVRGIYRINGTFVYKFSGDKGTFTYNASG
jgi:hypothetical protein